MGRKVLILFFLMFGFVYAQKITLGIGAGMDFYTIKGQSSNFYLSDATPSFLEREEVSNPFSVTAELKIKHENIAYGGNIDVVYKEYNVAFNKYLSQVINPIIGLMGTDTVTTNTQAPWLRAGLNVFVLYNLLKRKAFVFRLGGGLGLQIVAPIVTEKFLVETVENKLQTFDPTTDVDPEVLKNFELRLEADYALSERWNLCGTIEFLFVQKGKYDEPSSFPVFKAVLSYAIWNQ